MTITSEITHQIAIQVLYPWLEEVGGVSTAQLDAIESQLEDNLGLKLEFEDGCALLVHVDQVILALAGIINADGEDPKQCQELGIESNVFSGVQECGTG